MAQTREFTTEDIQEQLRREMPVLDVPEKLSAENVAAVLKQKKNSKKTPIYVWVRSAVAAVAVLAVGFGAIRAAGMLGGKKGEAYNDESFPEESGGSYYYAGDGETDSYSSAEAPSFANDAAKEVHSEETKVTVLAPGEELVIGTEVPFAGTDIRSEVSYGTVTGNTDDICKVRLIEDDQGQAEIELNAVSAGSISVELIRNGETQYHIDITVAE